MHLDWIPPSLSEESMHVVLTWFGEDWSRNVMWYECGWLLILKFSIFHEIGHILTKYLSWNVPFVRISYCFVIGRDAVDLTCLSRLYLGINCSKSVTDFWLSFCCVMKWPHPLTKNWVHRYVFQIFSIFVRGGDLGSFVSFYSQLVKNGQW